MRRNDRQDHSTVPTRITMRHGIWRWAAAVVVAVGILGGSSGVASADGLIDSFSATPASTLAGAHGDLQINLDPVRVEGGATPLGLVRTVEMDLPPGMIGTPQLPVCRLSRITTTVCPEDTQVGTLRFDIAYPFFTLPFTSPIYNVERRPGTLARLAFTAQGFSTPTIDFRVREGGDYGVTAVMSDMPSAIPITNVQATLWGIPADESHDTMRVRAGDDITYYSCIGPDGPTGDICPSDAPHRPFLTNPTRCDAAGAVQVRMNSWGDPNVFSSAESDPLTFEDCAAVPFDASLTVRPDTATAGAPTGLDVDLKIPRVQDEDPLERSVSAMRTTTMALPTGMAISPAAAEGLRACTDEELGLGTTNDPRCPDSAKVGTVTVHSPVTDQPLTGSVYLGNQRSTDPESGEMYRLLLVAEGSGVRVKLRGSIRADKNTGQLTTTFADNPELPFDELQLRFFGGDHAVLVNPPTCGTHTASYSISSWSGKTVQGSDSFATEQNCPSGRFAPSFTAGTVGPWAGAFSPFAMTVSRTDADQDLSRLNLTMPPGLLANLGSVPLCGAAQAAAGTCDAGSQIGSTTVSAGSGGDPFVLPGKVYLGGPYKGAPFSLSIVVPAKAGPLDLGIVVVRSELRVDAAHAQAAAVTDPFPTIVGGVPLRLRMVNVTLDRPGFMFNATNCTPMTVGGSLVSSSGSVFNASVPYQARRCDKMKLLPSLKLGLSGAAKEFRKNGHPAMTADMTLPGEQANLKGVKVVLPSMLALAAANAQALCKPAEAAARKCPDGSIVGHATAKTPALHEPLSGPVYFVENTRVSGSGTVVGALPRLWLKLEGEGVPLDLWADSKIDSAQSPQRLVTTFTDVPDAPLSSFRLEITGGKHGILGSTTAVCAVSRTDRKAEVTFDGHNGGRLDRRVSVKPVGCGLDVVSKAMDASRVKVRVSGIGAGTLTISGQGIKKTHRTIKGASVATISAKLTKTGQRMGKAGKALHLKVGFDPKAKGQKAASTKTTVKQGK